MKTATAKKDLFKIDAPFEDVARAVVNAPPPKKSKTVFSKARDIVSPSFVIPKGVKTNAPNVNDGLILLAELPAGVVPVVVFDPQYRGVLDYQGFGNEGDKRGRARAELPQMGEDTITEFIHAISRVLIPSGHLFLWVDKFHLCNGIDPWISGTDLFTVDMVVWHKERLGMGYRTRRTCESLVVIQKAPKRAKGVWKIHNIPDVWSEAKENSGHTHRKPIGLQSRLIEAVTNEGDFVVDPAAGSYSVLKSCQEVGRNFIGCDIVGTVKKGKTRTD
ncbi:MAG: DNA methyltransferase [Candidatus Dadabacteria bacterium]|nr:DNA methyltransferase [Candidatus Dadabacteria bacterium]